MMIHPACSTVRRASLLVNASRAAPTDPYPIPLLGAWASNGPDVSGSAAAKTNTILKWGCIIEADSDRRIAGKAMSDKLGGASQHAIELARKLPGTSLAFAARFKIHQTRFEVRTSH